MTLPSSENSRARFVTFTLRPLPVKLAVLQNGQGHRRTLGGLRARGNAARRAQDHQFRIVLLEALAPEKSSEDRDITQPWNFIDDVSDAIVDQSGNDKTLAILQLEFGIGLAGADGGNGRAGNADGVGVVERAHLGHDMHMNVAIGLDYGGELEAHTELAELNGDGCDAAGVLLRHGKRKFTSGEKTGFLAIDGNQIGFGQYLQETFLLEGLDHCAQMNLRVKEEQVQQVVYVRVGGGRTALAAVVDRSQAGDATELAGGDVPDCISRAGREHVDTELSDGRAIDFGELDFEQDLLGADGAKGQDVDDILGVGRGKQARVLGNIFGGDVAGENDGVSRRCDLNLLVGKEPGHLFAGGGDIDIDAQIETAGAFQFIPDEQRD